MTEEIKEIPKELQLEQNKFVKTLFKAVLELQEELKKLKEDKGSSNTKNYVDEWEKTKQYGAETRHQSMNTRRDIRLINGEGRVCCFFCDGVVKGN